ncbi:hypothetical protein [Leifsonia aquatica]|uniref:Uncharacterized protein n=2 Tax=Leifsonia aquatica TaxID=144185 RepID=U2TDK5_LEIAQ|nr:hypothetical protein [Leifsonia aquatica]ERK72792.1 hypothetical protein N136_00830 [Leifsonia aquatica ATCC 14665]MBB2965299.1 hypothetical protein [Leifsonia aquatica]
MSAPRGVASATIVRLRSVPVERTPQRLDPLGVQSAWLLVPLIGATAIGYAVTSTIWHRDQLRAPALAIAAIVVLVLAVAVAAVRTHPGLAPFGRWSHVAVIGLAIAAACLFDASVWGHNLRIQDDWGQIAIALLLIAMPLYRPVLEVLAAALAGAVVVGALAALQSGTLAIHTGPIVYATVAATPVLALALGGAGYAWTMTGETLRWREVARAGQERLEGELRDTAQRQLAQESTAAFEEIVPFLDGVLARGEITAADRDRAGELASGLRALAVSSVERTWLDETVELALAGRGHPDGTVAPSRVHDPDRLDRVLTDEQRAIVSALVATVSELPGLDPGSLRIDVAEPEHPSFELTARLAQQRRGIRRELVPYLSALRSVSMETGLRVRAGELTLRFAYPGSRRP